MTTRIKSGAGMNCFAENTASGKCRSVCITCKLPCQKCLPINQFKSSSTDTDDFEKYLDSQTRKIKVQPKVKTLGVDTCDLDGHFDYYKQDKKAIIIQKNVATDCADLNIRQIVNKKLFKNTVATDTNDLLVQPLKSEKNESKNCGFYGIEEDSSAHKKTNNTSLISINCNRDYQDVVISKENLLGTGDKISPLSSITEKEDDKENYNHDNNSKEITFDSSTSEDSDVDLVTSCNLSKTRKLAKKHKITLKQIRTDSGLLFQCNICKETFVKKYLGTLHIGTHIENDRLKCLRCHEHFKSLDLMFLHVQHNHLNISEEKVSSDSALDDKERNCDQDNPKPKVGKIFHCALCSNGNGTPTQFGSYKALYLHKKIKHGIVKAKEVDRQGEKKLRIKREFVCLTCGKQFKSLKALKDHSPVHTGEKNYRCDICNKSYTTSANLKIHKRTHTGTRNFVCSVCNKAFHKKDSLKVHFRKHSGERPFQCDLCPMRFDRKYTLKNHRYTHFSEKTFICPFCGKTFTTHGGLNNHEKIHKKDPMAKKPRKPAVKPTLETENAVICDVCGKIYSTRSNLRIHKFVHLGIKPFECSVCHQSYAKKDSMLTHMRKHYDDRPFTCETCGMKFFRNHTLKTHLLRHTGERPHKCKICGKSFTQSSSLAYHVKNHDRKVERKRVVGGDSVKTKKKRVGSDGGSSSKKVGKSVVKPPSTGFHSDEGKQYEVKKTGGCKEVTVLKNPLTINLPEKEILLLDKNLTVELARNINAEDKDVDLMTVEKDSAFNNQSTLGKFNYYIAKSHVFSFPKETATSKCVKTEEEADVPENSGYLAKDLNAKEEFQDRLDLKPQTATIPVTNEILNATFISDENGDVIPFSSMTLHGLNADNVMISPVITLESEEKKSGLKNSKVTVVDSKVMYNLQGNRLSSDKLPSKGGCHIINLRDARIPQRIHIELESSTLQFQAPIEDGTLQNIPGFYGTIQQNEL